MKKKLEEFGILMSAIVMIVVIICGIIMYGIGDALYKGIKYPYCKVRGIPTQKTFFRDLFTEEM